MDTKNYKKGKLAREKKQAELGGKYIVSAKEPGSGRGRHVARFPDLVSAQSFIENSHYSLFSPEWSNGTLITIYNGVSMGGISSQYLMNGGDPVKLSKRAGAIYHEGTKSDRFRE